MDHLDELLQELNFTQYEAQSFITLIKYKMLSAREIHKYSGVPQPKIYETMIRLQKRGLIDIIPKGKKKIYMIKPREVLQEYLLSFSRKVEDFALDFDTFIESSFYVHGEYDWIITFVTKDINHALKFSESVLAQNPGIIERVTILQTMMFIRKHYILNPDRKELKEYL